MRKLVHLDLKGGVPKMPYFLSLLPLMKQCGATGLLVEYENVFPYKGDLSVLAAEWAYSEAEIQQLLHACNELSLEIIPLVQTFGHAEFILSHEKFRHLREHADHPNCFCPSQVDSLVLIESMLVQILEAHPAISNFHIGCDEVSPLGICCLCKEKMQRTQCDTSELYLDHVTNVSLIVKRHRPEINVLIWDDMIRKVDVAKMTKFGLNELVEPMVWYYGKDSIPDVFATYTQIFPRIWCASAFKGASGCAETIPNLELHISNTKLWKSVMQDLIARGVQIAGIALTGWSRYDYYGVQCELLPAAIPSLVICLRTLCSEFGWTESVHLESSQILGVDYCIPIEWKPRPKPIIVDLKYPGNEIFVGSQCQANLHVKFVQFVSSDIYKGWWNKCNVQRAFINSGTAKQLAYEAARLREEFVQLREKMSPAMHACIVSQNVEEWFGEHLDTYIEKLEGIVEKVAKVLQQF